MNDEQYRTGHHDIWIFSSDAGSDWDVWLEPSGGEFDGVCIGGGATRDAAVQDAVNALEAALAKLQETPSPEAMKEMIDTGDLVLREDGTFESLTEGGDEE